MAQDAVDYSTLNKAELQEEIDRRNADPNRGAELHLNRTGTNVELIDRLTADDRRQQPEEDLLDDDEFVNPDMRNLLPEADDTPEPPAPTDDPPQPPVVEPPQAAVQSEPAPSPVKGKTYEARYEMSGADLGAGLHQEFLVRIVAEAQAAGHSVKGGAYRDRFEDVGGKRYVVYRVHLRG